VHKWLELLNDQLNVNILKTIKLAFGVCVIQLELPLADVNYLVSQIAKFNMTVIFTEIVNALLGENGLDEIVTITHQNCGNDLDDEKTHRLL
jgi:hypothetical protein